MYRHLSTVAVRAAAVVALGAALASGSTAAAGAAAPAPTPEASSQADAGTAPLVTFGISPASGGRPDTRSYVALTAPPGSVVYDDIAVLNQSDVPLDLDVYAADVANDKAGTLGLPARSVAPSRAGSWLTLGASTVSVAPQSTTDGIGFVVVPVTITIPADAEPGDHVAGVVAAMTTQGAGGANSPAVDLEQRTGARIYVTVDGPLEPGLAVTDVHAGYDAGRALGVAGPGALTVTYTLTNTGNVRYGVEPSVRASGPFGLLARTADGTKVDELLPGASVEQTVAVPEVWPLVIESVTVSAAAVSTLGRDDPGIGTVTGSTRAWAVPWPLLVLVVLLLSAWLVVRRRRRRPTPPAPTANPPAPAVPQLVP